MALIIKLINGVGRSYYFRAGRGLCGDFLKRGSGFEQNGFFGFFFVLVLFFCLFFYFIFNP